MCSILKMPDVLAKQIASLDSHAKNCEMLATHIEAIKRRIYDAKVHVSKANNSYDKEVKDRTSSAKTCKFISKYLDNPIF